MCTYVKLSLQPRAQEPWGLPDAPLCPGSALCVVWGHRYIPFLIHKMELTSQNHGKDKLMQRPWHKLSAHIVKDMKVLDLALKRMTQCTQSLIPWMTELKVFLKYPSVFCFFSRYQLRRGQGDKWLRPNKHMCG